MHPFAELVLNPGSTATAGLLFTPCPGTQGVEIRQALQQLKDAGAKALITLTPEEEMIQLQATDIAAMCRELDLLWFFCPIHDDHAPGLEFAHGWQEASPMVQQLLRTGQKVAIHCKGGSGRTGLVAAKILLEAGFDKIVVKQRVQAIRPYAITLQPHLDWFNAQ